MGGHGVPRIVRPGMRGIAPLQLFLHLGVAVFPEPLQVPGDLNGTPRWGQKVNEDRHAPACHRGSYGEAEEFLEFDRQDGQFSSGIVQGGYGGDMGSNLYP